MSVQLNTAGRCDRCGAIVQNATGRRLTRDQLIEHHAATCPGIHRGRPDNSKERT